MVGRVEWAGLREWGGWVWGSFGRSQREGGPTPNGVDARAKKEGWGMEGGAVAHRGDVGERNAQWRRVYV
jgi:hypothetical protein